jgi:polyvinyl alcohol dehydrogenase (cytochrome)
MAVKIERVFARTFLIMAVASTLSAQSTGEAVYQKRCATCHEQIDPRIPTRDALKRLSVARILRTLDFGVMMSVAYPLRRDEREAVAAYLGVPGGDTPPASQAFCADRTVNLAGVQQPEWNGWSPSPNNTRYQTAAAAKLSVDQARRLKLKWAFGFDGDITAFAQPAIIGNYLFVGSAAGRIYALNAATGCIHWYFEANGPVRSAMLAVPAGRQHALLFSDQTGWVYSIEAETGRLRWKKKIEPHEATRLTGAPVAYQDVVFFPAASWEENRSTNPEYECCTFRGSLTALRIRDGALVWKTYTIAEPAKATTRSKSGTQQWGPSGAGVWGSPTLDAKRGVIYITTGDNYSSPATATSDSVMALGLKTGKIMWSKQTLPNDAYNSSCGGGGPNCPPEKGPDFDFGSSVLLEKLAGGRELLFAGQKSGVVYALDPDKKGEIVWQARVGKGSAAGGVQWGMASDGQKIYAAVSDTARKNGQLDTRAGGGLTALRPSDGETLWYAAPSPCEPPKPGCSPAQSAAVTAIPGVVFSGSLDGHLRAFAAEDGKVLWDMDTARDYQTVNGVQGRGGSLDGPGAVVVSGMVFVNSGYPRFGGMPGNVLLAFAPEE